MKNCKRLYLSLLAVGAIVLLALTACAAAPAPDDLKYEPGGMPELSTILLGEGELLKVVATTSIVYDVVAKVAGDLIDLTLLIPLGTDPHGFEPRPQDVAAISKAHVLFANGVGLEAFLDPLLESAGAAGRAVPVSHGIDFLEIDGADDEHENHGEDRRHTDADPHTWMNPNNVKVWVHNIKEALVTLDPDNAAQYRSNAADYVEELQELDSWVRQRVAEIPDSGRKLVTDHLVFAYLADEYGFEQVGAVVPGFSSLAEPSARELAELVDSIQDTGVNAIFVGYAVNPSLAQTIALDTGVQLVYLYTGSLSDQSGDAATYLEYIQYNVNAIVEALR